MRRDRRKALFRRKKDSLEGPHEKADIQRKALRRGKSLTFSKQTCHERKGDPKESRNEIETEAEVE